jgi:hypothetical protein
MSVDIELDSRFALGSFGVSQNRENLMRIPGKTLAGVLLVIGGGFAWWQFNFPTVSYRYRLTVTVETDGDIHAGSSVIELFFRFSPKWLGPSGGTYNVSVTGQAVLIDLGPRGAFSRRFGGRSV